MRKPTRLLKFSRTKKTAATKSLAKKKRAPKKRARKVVARQVVTSKATSKIPPLPGQGKRGETGYLGYLLRQAQAAARLTLERALADLDVTPAQFVVLTMVKAYPGLSGADLARVAVLTPQTVGLIIRNLERAGSIRKAPHPVHGRVLQWSLTRRGMVLLARCQRHVRIVEKRLAGGLSARNGAIVRKWLARVAVDMAASDMAAT